MKEAMVRLPLLLSCMAIVVLGFSGTPVQGDSVSGRDDVPALVEERTAEECGPKVRIETGSAQDCPGERSAETGICGADATTRVEPEIRKESEKRFGFLMLILQVLRESK